MAECTSAAVYKNIKHCPGDLVTPGIRAEVFFIPKADIASWPTPDPNNGVYTSEAKFTLQEGKKWHTIKGMKTQGNVKAEPTGEKPICTFDVTLNVFVPGTKNEVIAFANMAVNDDLVFAYMTQDGALRVIGTEFGDVDVKPSLDTGSKSGDNCGETCAITSNMPYQPLALADISCLGAVDDGAAA